jgi:LAO/AO transport system kinase
VSTVAVKGEGLEALVEALDRHRAYLEVSGELAWRERERLAHELEARLRDQLLAALQSRLGADGYARLLDQIIRRQIDPATAARELARGAG